jgi:predicted DNA-binding transcriptional regulator AlpA
MSALTAPSAAPGAPTRALLPPVGMSRWANLSQFIPVSRETWRQLVIAGKAPQPVKLSARCTMYSNPEVYRWLADPLGYRPEQGGANA